MERRLCDQVDVPEIAHHSRGKQNALAMITGDNTTHSISAATAATCWCRLPNCGIQDPKVHSFPFRLNLWSGSRAKPDIIRLCSWEAYSYVWIGCQTSAFNCFRTRALAFCKLMMTASGVALKISAKVRTCSPWQCFSCRMRMSPAVFNAVAR
jgi:hypothetical protein